MPKSPRGKPPSQRVNRLGADLTALRYTAHHEAGHAVAAIVLDIELTKVDLHPRQIESGRFTSGRTLSPPVKVEGIGADKALPHIIVLGAGALAEQVVNPHALEGNGHHADAISVRGIAQAALCESIEKDGDRVVPQDEFERKRESMVALIDRGLDAAAELVRQHLDAIRAVAKALLERRELSGDEVRAIVTANPPKPLGGP
jgi:ATP-dependent Zn protease